MKPKEYIEKYALDRPGVMISHNEFFRDLTMDFERIIAFRADENMPPLTKHAFNSVCVKDIRAKFDAIRRLVANPKSLEEKHWGFFFATVIVPQRDKLFGV